MQNKNNSIFADYQKRDLKDFYKSEIWKLSEWKDLLEHCLSEEASMRTWNENELKGKADKTFKAHLAFYVALARICVFKIQKQAVV